MTEVVIDKRFCGPRAFANGGYAAGRFASVIDGPAEVMLKAPAPFDTPIDIIEHETDPGRFSAMAGDAEIATVRPGAVSITPPAPPDDRAVAAARQAFVDDGDMTLYYPYCFVCGKRRDAGDGMRIFAGPVPGSEMNADCWAPSEDLAGEDGLVRPEFIWAALDCPSAFALRMDNAPVLLGRFTADVRRRPEPGERLLVAAWRDGEEGRKHYSSSAVYDEKRDMIAAANAVWIELNDPALLARLRAENE